MGADREEDSGVLFTRMSKGPRGLAGGEERRVPVGGAAEGVKVTGIFCRQRRKWQGEGERNVS